MTDRRAAVAPVGIGVLVVAVGVAATWGRFGPANVPNGLPPLLAGWAMAASGLTAWVRVPWSRVGPLLALAGLATFLTDFSSCLSIVPISHRCLSVGVLGTLAGQLAFAWTGFFAHALIAFPTGRAATSRQRLSVAVAYVVALLPMLWRADAGPLILPALLAGVLVTGWLSADRRTRAERGPALLAASGMTLAMAVIYLIGFLTSRPGVDQPSALELIAAVAAIGVASALLGSSRDPTRMADLVIELGESRQGAVADALALATGDRTLQVGFQSGTAGTFVDGAGRPIELPPPGSTDRSVVAFQRDGRPVAVLIHDAAMGSGPALRAALAAAADLTAANASLQAEAHGQFNEVLASRRRLLDAAVEERRELEERLHDGPEQHLDLLAVELSAARATVADPAITSRLDRAIEQLVETRTEVRELARGLHPRDLEERGLRGALIELAERASVPVELTMDIDAAPGTGIGIGATIYFVTSEALANVAKYAPASRVRITLERSADGIQLVFTDDGPGGADPTAGSGLRGLADRVEALGGSFDIDSRPGHGTRLAATIPSGGEAQEARRQ